MVYDLHNEIGILTRVVIIIDFNRSRLNIVNRGLLLGFKRDTQRLSTGNLSYNLEKSFEMIYYYGSKLRSALYTDVADIFITHISHIMMQIYHYKRSGLNEHFFET